MGLCKEQRQERIAELAKAIEKLRDVSREELKEIFEEAGLKTEGAEFILKSDSRAFKALEGLSPEQIWRAEITRCLALNFHKALGLTEQQFADKDFFPLPEEKPNPLAIIPEVITRTDKRLLLDISSQMALVEVDGKTGRNYLDLTEHKDLIEIPDRIYWIYEVEDGSRFAVSDPLTSPEQEEKILKKEKRTPFASIHGIALVRRFPKILKHHYLDLPGSRCRSSRVPYLRLYCDRPGLVAYYADVASSDYGVPSFRSV